MPRDRVARHADYETDTLLTRRLAIMQGEVSKVLEERAGTTIPVLSLCSDEGRDLIVPLATRAGQGLVQGFVVELAPGRPDPVGAFGNVGARRFITLWREVRRQCAPPTDQAETRHAPAAGPLFSAASA